jgi:hypothetical protein
MPTDLERRLDAAADRLPLPSEEARRRGRESALAALPPAKATPAEARGRRRIRLAAGAAALVAAVAVAVTLVTNLEGTSPFTTEKALAAIGDQPVVHAAVESERPWATIVDLVTGEERSQFHRTEYWHDAERGLLLVELTVDGDVVSRFVQTREGFSDGGPIVRGPWGEPRLDPALAGFATRYREALESGRAQVIDETEMDGREVVVLEIDIERPVSAPAVHQEVVVDADTYRPIRFRFVFEGRAAHWWRVLSIATLRREDGRFDPPPLGPPRAQSQTGTDERELTPAEAAQVLGVPALWPGRVVDGIELTKIEVMKLTTRWTDGREREGHGLRLEYGGGIFGRVPRSLEIRQGASREEAPRFGPYDPGVPPGHLQVYGFGINDGSKVDRWFGSLRTQGMFVTIESPEREVVLAAARALRPIDES